MAGVITAELHTSSAQVVTSIGRSSTANAFGSSTSTPAIQPIDLQSWLLPHPTINRSELARITRARDRISAECPTWRAGANAIDDAERQTLSGRSVLPVINFEVLLQDL